MSPALQHGIQLVVVHDDQVFFEQLLLDVLVQLLWMELHRLKNTVSSLLRACVDVCSQTSTFRQIRVFSSIAAAFSFCLTRRKLEKETNKCADPAALTLVYRCFGAF